MEIHFLQFVLIVTIIFTLSRAYIRYKSRKLTLFGFLFWAGIFGSGMFGVIFPELTGIISKRLGIGRGADVFVYLSVVILFYLVFRLYAYVEDLKSEMVNILREATLKHPLKEK